MLSENHVRPALEGPLHAELRHPVADLQPLTDFDAGDEVGGGAAHLSASHDGLHLHVLLADSLADIRRKSGRW